jgi:hypothetical protein
MKGVAKKTQKRNAVTLEYWIREFARRLRWSAYSGSILHRQFTK